MTARTTSSRRTQARFSAFLLRGVLLRQAPGFVGTEGNTHSMLGPVHHTSAPLGDLAVQNTTRKQVEQAVPSHQGACPVDAWLIPGSTAVSGAMARPCFSMSTASRLQGVMSALLSTADALGFWRSLHPWAQDFVLRISSRACGLLTELRI